MNLGVCWDQSTVSCSFLGKHVVTWYNRDHVEPLNTKASAAGIVFRAILRRPGQPCKMTAAANMEAGMENFWKKPRKICQTF